jgi:hypothetical protein
MYWAIHRSLTAIAALTACALGPSMAIAQSHCRVADPTDAQIDARARPNGNVVGTLPNGTIVTVVDHTTADGRSWVFVKRIDNDAGVGWVARNSIDCPIGVAPFSKFELKCTIRHTTTRTRDPTLSIVLIFLDRGFAVLHRARRGAVNRVDQYQVLHAGWDRDTFSWRGLLSRNTGQLLLGELSPGRADDYVYKETTFNRARLTEPTSFLESTCTAAPPAPATSERRPPPRDERPRREESRPEPPAPEQFTPEDVDRTPY